MNKFKPKTQRDYLFIYSNDSPELYSSFGVIVSMDVILGDCIRLDRFKLRLSKFLSSSPDVSMLNTS
jgi:hypothetical protein